MTEKKTVKPFENKPGRKPDPVKGTSRKGKPKPF